MAPMAGRPGEKGSISPAAAQEDDHPEFATAVSIHPHELRLGRLLGSGKTAEVYLALWRGEAVAVKQMLSPFTSESEIKAFHREVSILAKVSHPSIVRLFGYCLSSNPCHLVSEFCEGGTLFDLLYKQADQDLTLKQQVKMCNDIACAMDYLHKYRPQILHRDLKSLNLLLTKALTGLKDIPTIKVADFGLARVLEPRSRVDLTKFVGTVHWMAPEIFTSRTYDEKVDVYSYGMVVFEIFAMEPPFEDERPEDIERLVRSGGRPDAGALPPNLPRGLRDFIFSAWAHDPKERPSFEQVLQLLSRVHSGPYATAGGPAAASSSTADQYCSNRSTKSTNRRASYGYLSKTSAIGAKEARRVCM